MAGSRARHVIKESHPDWKAFKGRAARDVLFSRFAYKQHDAQMQELADKMPDGYEMFLMTDHLDDTKEASFRCAAFMNWQTKEVVFATAGTRLGRDVSKMGSDLFDDALLAASQKPRKLNPAQVLNDMILDSLGAEASEYKFHYTGHSLGAAMAEMQAVDMDIKLTQRDLKAGEEQISAVTFENPGTKKILSGMYKDAGLPAESAENLRLYEFNNRPNMINSLNEQAGEVYVIEPNSQKENPSLIQMVIEFVTKKDKETSPFVGWVISLLEKGCDSYVKNNPLAGQVIGLLEQGLNLYSDHKLDNFDEVFVQKEGRVTKNGELITVEEAYSGVKPMEYDEQIASRVVQLKKEEGDTGKQEYAMNHINPETGEVSRILCGREELEVAVALIQSEIGNAMQNIIARKAPTALKSKEESRFELPSAAEIVKDGLER
ncbi:MAG: hypothetical protein COA94_01420 [Rickettsiales bacterium]|nr:MAG: hypothetical protein COA94_01420 [Rickettsiales bacterium]